MSAPFVAEITMYAFNFAPKGWAFCAGQLLPISQNTALFSLLGTNYGGDGKSTFGLPDMQGNAAVGQGQSSASGTQYFVGETTGVQNVTLLTTEMPSHNHGFTAWSDTGTTLISNQNQLAKAQTGGKQSSYTGNYLNTAGINITMSPGCTTPTGSSFPHNNMQPYLALNFCIALQGVFPARP
ncbi:MAG: phage tail protein [Alphaproteobacteria bacterium]|nr:phage tail protein [Alphaproteobacteria bacterium]MBV9694621.1 phage tail protein [Alphaproteobacteria bacterium]